MSKRSFITTGKKVLATAVSAAMVVAFTPVVAWGALQEGETLAAVIGNEEYGSLSKAISEAQSRDTPATIVLKDNLEYSEATCFDISKDITIDLNGHSLTALANGSCPDKAKTHLFLVKSGGKLTIDDSSSGKTGVITAGYNGNSELYVFDVLKGATLEILGGTVQNAPGAGTNFASTTVYNESGTFNFKGGTIRGNDAVKTATPVTNGGTMTMIGGTIFSDDQFANGISQAGTLTIEGGTIDTIGTAIMKTYPLTYKSTSVEGGSFRGHLQDDSWIAEGRVGVVDENGFTTISETKPSEPSAVVRGTYYYSKEADTALAIKNAINNDSIVLNKTPSEGARTAKSFTFGGKLLIQLGENVSFDPASITVDSSYADKCTIAAETDETGVTTFAVVGNPETAEAKIQDRCFPTLSLAIAYASGGDEIILNSDVKLYGNNVSISKSLTLNLNPRVANRAGRGNLPAPA